MTITDAQRDERIPARLQATYVPATAADMPRRPGHLALWGTDDPEAAASALGFVDGGPGHHTTVLARTPRAYKRVVVAHVPALVVPLVPAVRALVALDVDALPAWRTPGPSLLAWRQAALLACELIAACRIVPALQATEQVDTTDPTDRTRPSARAHWRLAHAGDLRVPQLAGAMPVAAHAVPRPSDADAAEGIWSAHSLLDVFLDDVADALARQAGDTAARTAFGRALVADDSRLSSLPRGHQPQSLARALQTWALPVVGDGTPSARLTVRLHTPDTTDGPLDDEPSADEPSAEDGSTDVPAADDRWPLDYLLQATHDPSLQFDAADVWATTDSGTDSTTDSGLADVHLPDAQEALVRGLGEAARLFPPIDASLSEPSPTGLDLTSDQAAALLTQGAAELAAAGIGVQLPSELTRGGQAKLRARMRVGTSTSTPGQSGGPSLGMDELGEFQWEVAVDDDTLTAEEFAQLAAHKRSLVRWRGRWVHVDPDQLEQLAAAIGSDGTLDSAQAVAALLAGEVDDAELGAVEVVADAAAQGLLARLVGTDPPTPRLDGIDATLRPYQHRGVAWLQARADLGLGAVLADDMGLGKTLQSIAVMAGRDGTRPHLVVCPASVVGNWEREIAKFAPHLLVLRHHGPARPDAVDGFPVGGVSITTYGTLRSDAELLADVDWDVVVLDEAQAFKNPGTRTSRAVRALPAVVKLPMTGTPVENRLAELWSIMEVAVPGLLGSLTSFVRDLARPIERWADEAATDRLRRLTAPFVLRRTKQDPDIAPDLPDKQEQDVPVPLTAEQATLYQAIVDETFAEDLGEGIERRGAVLKMLGALKQVCNHPAQYLGQAGPMVGRSGKLTRTTELLAEVVAAGDRALVFTQYRRMGDLLAGHLTDQLDVPEVPFLHGGTSLARRDDMVDAFQHDAFASPILLVSLKAGGTGLNLTNATHVVHYDRWWNPAVEDQATDRAYRIGQDRTVFVHKLTTMGTLEERIADLLQAKRSLAEAVVGSGEAWLTELDDDALRELVTLDANARGDAEAVGAERVG